ncbi:MAG: hypothetical protein LUQ65_08670 [Candidatus Helarchaeota archaeon]|nr:hypothetical protein [Candidatus Helarchaeota archaeon]
MYSGWVGKNLEIDLSQRKSSRNEGDSVIYESYLGARGIGTKVFWDRVPPEVSPFSRENLLIFGAGVLTGTPAPGGNRIAIVTRSPQTNLLTYSTLGGFWGAELKHAGYDNIIISGKSSSPLYLFINDDHAEMLDASHLWGRDTRETQRIIRAELKNDKVQVLCIGPAGENRVYAASIEHNPGASASRAGVGAIMGDKKLKAIAVFGTKDVHISRPQEFFELCEQTLSRTGDARKFHHDTWPSHAGSGLWKGGLLGYMEEYKPLEDAEARLRSFLEKSQVKISTCYNCGIACKSTIRLPDGGYSFVKCQSWYPFMCATKLNDDLEFGMQCYHLCERYGLDSLSTASYVAFAINLYQKGILTKRETDGMHLEWRNKDIAFSIIEKIARREGIGEILANGLLEAARQIGAPVEVYHLKGLEQYPYMTPLPYLALCNAISDRGDGTRVESSIPQRWLAKSREWKEEYLKLGYFHYPEKFEKYFLDDFDYSGADYKRIIDFISFDIDRNTFCDCTGTCTFWAGFWPYNPIQFKSVVDFTVYATGKDMDESRAMKISRRVSLLLRAYNVLLGIRKKDDRVSEKYFQNLRTAPYVRMDRQLFEMMIDEYYKIRGLNTQGIPSMATLVELGLEDVYQELERRGIL